MNHQRRKINGALAAAALFAPWAAWSQAFPTHPLRMIIPFAPGGTTDVIGRLVAQHLSDLLGQQVIADNRSGASGNIGTDLAAKSPPDGYTMVMSFDGTMTINPHTYRKLPYRPVEDFAPVTLTAYANHALAVGPAVPASVKTLSDFLAWAKAAGCRDAVDGLGMLVEQAAEAFEAWHGARPDSDVVYAALRGKDALLVTAD